MPSRFNIPLRVSQLYVACAFCKGRKIKCDGVQPACGACVKYGRASTCSLRDDPKLQSRDYVTYLERRIHTLQQKLEGGPAPQSSSAHQPGLPTIPWGSLTSHTNRAGTAKTIDDLISEMGALPIIKSSNNPEISSQEPSLADVALAAAGCHETRGSKLSLDDIPSQLLPDRGLAQKLVDHYLSSVYPRLPFFSIAGLWTQVELAYSSTAAQFRQMAIPSPDSSHSQLISTTSPHASLAELEESQVNATIADRGYALFAVLMVLSISTSSFSKSLDSLASHNGEKLFCAALRFRDFALIPNTIVGVQSMLFLIQYATINPSRLDSWYLIGVGMRVCLDLGLQHDPEEVVEKSLLETRRRLFWSMYSFDRSISLGLGRPLELVDDLISAALPEFRIDSSFPEVDIHLYIQRHNILRLQSLAYDRFWFPAEPVHLDEVLVFEKRFDVWKADNPQSTAERTVALLETEWLQARMIIFSPCRAIVDRAPQDLIKLWDASLTFIRIYKTFVDRNEIFYIQVACKKVYASGLNILYAFWQLSLLDDQPDHNHQSSSRITNLWAGISDVKAMMRALSSRWEEGEILAKKFDKISTRMLTSTSVGPLEGNLSPNSGSELPCLREIRANSLETINIDVPPEVRHLWKHVSPSMFTESAMPAMSSAQVQRDMKELLQGFVETGW